MQMPMSAVLSASDPLLSNIVADQGNPYLRPLPYGYDALSAVSIQDNLAVIPGEWECGKIKSAFYELQTEDVQFVDALAKITSADFIAWDESFFDLVLGPDAVLEKIIGFPEPQQNVHEAPVYFPETGELIFCDTSVIGSLFAVNVKDGTYQTRTITTNPPLANVNGGTYFNGSLYALTNGSPVRGIYRVDPVTGTSFPVVNNYRGRHLNSPNDVIMDSHFDLWFTDPLYGWFQSWPGVQEPKLPSSIYFFNVTSRALLVMSNSVVGQPNGLAFSPDESVLYTETGWPDGIRVTSTGLLIVAVAGGADVVDPQSGVLLGKINTPGDIVYNVEPIPGTGTWFLTGGKSIYEVRMKAKAVERNTIG